MMQRRFRAWLVAGLFGVMVSLAAMPARAAIITYSYSITLSGVGGFSGTFDVDDTTNLIVSVTGSGASIGTITGVLATGTLGGNDNLFSSTEPYFTSSGLAVSTTLFKTMLIFYDVDNGYGVVALYNNGTWVDTGDVLTLTVTRVTTAVPEPGSMALLLSGLVGIGMVARRQRNGFAQAA